MSSRARCANAAFDATAGLRSNAEFPRSDRAHIDTWNFENPPAISAAKESRKEWTKKEFETGIIEIEAKPVNLNIRSEYRACSSDNVLVIFFFYCLKTIHLEETMKKIAFVLAALAAISFALPVTSANAGMRHHHHHHHHHHHMHR